MHLTLSSLTSTVRPTVLQLVSMLTDHAPRHNHDAGECDSSKPSAIHGSHNAKSGSMLLILLKHLIRIATTSKLEKGHHHDIAKVLSLHCQKYDRCAWLRSRQAKRSYG